MYTKSSLVAFALFFSLWTSFVNCVAVAPADPTITPPPDLDLALQARQAAADGTVTCSNWTVPAVGNPICSPGSSCYHDFGTTGFAGCFPTAATFAAYKTACFDYPTTWPGVVSPSYVRYCTASAPVCGAIIYVDATGRWIDYTCDTTLNIYTAIDTRLLPAKSSSTIPTSTVGSSSYSTTTSISQNPSSSSPVPPPPPPTGDPNSSSNAAVIGGAVGGAVGGLALAIGAGLLIFCIRKRNRSRMQPQGAGIAAEQSPPEYRSPAAFQPPQEYHSPSTENKNATHVSEHC